MTEFDNFPHEINRMIGSYLDYNSRLEFGQLVSDLEDRPVKKINAEQHECAVQIRRIKEKLNRLDDRFNSEIKAFDLIKFIKFINIDIYSSKNIAFESSEFKEWMIELFTRRYSDDYWDNPWFHYIPAPLTDSIIKQTRILLGNLENYKPKLDYVLIPKFVEIK